MKLKSRIFNVIFWSVVSAAFIGPGTITTAAKAGTLFGFDLLWALLFSTIACLILQEAAARLTIVTGKNLGQTLTLLFPRKSKQRYVPFFVVLALLIGISAYETGNIIGASAGLELLFKIPRPLIIISIGAIAALILWLPSLRFISTLLGSMVILMGIGFLVIAWLLGPDLPGILKGLFVPGIPSHPDSGILLIGLIGTTVVPYNLFLGSGISKPGQSIAEMRLGLGTAILLGGIFSMSVLVVGNAIQETFSFEALASVLEEQSGNFGRYVLGFGLFAAGFTSSITAPLAAVIAYESTFMKQGNLEPAKQTTKITTHWVWILVILIGIVLALFNIKPVPAIIMAQALNGFLLPFITIVLFIAINAKVDIQNQLKSSPISNGIISVVILLTLFLGISNLGRALLPLFMSEFSTNLNFYVLILGISVLVTGFIVHRVLFSRQHQQ